jgi:outer membrane protein W
MPRNASRRVCCAGARDFVSAGVWILMLAMLPAAAAAEVEHRFRIQGTWSNPTDEFREPDEDGDAVLEAEDELGVRIGYELLFRERWGVELAAGTTRHDVSASYGSSQRFELARIRVTPITASLLYHFNPRGKADFFLGGGAAYVHYGDFELSVPFTDPDDNNSFAVKSDLTYTLQAGLDLKLNDRWGLTGNVQWIDTDAEFADDEDGDKLPIAPLIVGAGVALRF